MIVDLIRWYLIICCLNYLLYELLIRLFARRMLKNGWGQKVFQEAEELMQEYIVNDPVNKSLVESPVFDFLTFFIPIMNLTFTRDIIYMIIFKAE